MRWPKMLVTDGLANRGMAHFVWSDGNAEFFCGVPTWSVTAVA